MERFQAITITKGENLNSCKLETVSESRLPPNDIMVEISYSSLNYKDALALSGKAGVVRRFPMIAGIDLAGTVIDSKSEQWKKGDQVVVNGWGLGETEPGGYSRYQRVKPEWLTRLHPAFTMQQAMAIGTAGYTAALCIDALEGWGSIKPGSGEVLVTGAAGGVGSIAIGLLASKGYTVAASTGRTSERDYLTGLGAANVFHRSELEGEGAALQKVRWTGAVDSVGGKTLANILAQIQYGGAVAACGLAGGSQIPATVAPHILRGVALLGIDSVMAPPSKRHRAWDMLAQHLDKAHLDDIARIEPMSRLPRLAEDILKGSVRGRVVIDVTA